MSSTDTARPQVARECLAPCRKADASPNDERILSAVRAAVCHGVGAVLQVVRGWFVKEAFFAVRDPGVAAFEENMRRARESGQLRRDVTFDDVRGTLARLTRPLPGGDRDDFDARVGRYIELLLAGLRGSAPSELPGSSPHVS
jgi:hypothetical protein